MLDFVVLVSTAGWIPWLLNMLHVSVKRIVLKLFEKLYNNPIIIFFLLYTYFHCGTEQLTLSYAAKGPKRFNFFRSLLLLQMKKMRKNPYSWLIVYILMINYNKFKIMLGLKWFFRWNPKLRAMFWFKRKALIAKQHEESLFPVSAKDHF